MHPPRTLLSVLVALLLVAAPSPGQPVDSVRLRIERAVLHELLTSDRYQQLRSAPFANYICLARRVEAGRDIPPPKGLLVPFADSSPPLVSVSECQLMNAAQYLEAEPEPKTRVHHKEDGGSAILYWIGPLEWVRGDSAFARAGYSVHPLHGADYECDVRRDSGQWTADCTVRFWGILLLQVPTTCRGVR